MEEVIIASAVRTPIGSFGGSLSSISATKLGAVAIKAALERANIAPALVQEVLFGNVVSANLGQAPARQAALWGGLPNGTICTTINKVCASGIKAITLATQSIQLGQNSVVVAGGMENMSQIPFYLPKARYGYGYGNGEIIDGLSKDGLTDVYHSNAMGCFADATAQKHEITREQQDAFAIQSYQRSASAWHNGHFNSEVVGVEIADKKGNIKTVAEDEEFKNVTFEKISTLRPVFSKEGTVTAANSSTINDGAAALVLTSQSFAKENSLQSLAKIIAYADAEQAPEWFTTAPILAAQKALKQANLAIDDIDFFEINEAFAVVPLAFAKVLSIPQSKINIWGGGVSLGHPLGCSGARILVTLLSVLKYNNARYGMAVICNGGGGATAVIVERT